MTSPILTANVPTDSKPPSSTAPPRTVASKMSGIFAFHPPFQAEESQARRQQTPSSISTEPLVVTPPTGLPLSRLATFNGHQPTRHLLSNSSSDTPSSPPSFGLFPPVSPSSDALVSPSYTGSPSVGSPFGYRPPSTSFHGAGAQPSQPSSRQLHSTDRSDPVQRDVGATSIAQIQEGRGSSLSDRASNLSLDKTSSGFSEKPKACDIYGSADEDLEIGRNQKPEPDTKPPWTPTLNVPSDDETYPDSSEDSPYPEVRASVSNIDDVEMPCLTFRVWVIGFLIITAGSAANIVFSFRYPSPYISPIITLLFAQPCGLALARLLPLRCWSLPRSLPVVGGWEFSLNPSPWTIKEHALVLIMSNPAINPDYGIGVISAIEKGHHANVSLGFTVLLLLSTQLIGISLGGLSRRILVQPASFIWPSSLIYCVALNTLHAGDAVTGGPGMSRARFFCYISIVAFLYSFLPGFLFTGLSYFSFICWMRPNNVVVNQLFGTVSGLGMGILTFDWNQIAYIGSPMMFPFWSQLNVMAGFILFYWIIVPALYYSDVWKTGHLPMSSSGAYDRFAEPYDIGRVVTPDHRLNVTAYEEYSPLYLPVTYAMTYLLAFMFSTALIVHTVLHYGPEALRRLRGKESANDDIHARLMRKYPEARSWYYWATLTGCAVMAVAAVKVEDFGIPVWAPLLALLVAVVYAFPLGYMFAMTGQLGGNNLVAQVIAGSLFPGSAIGNMIFKTIAVQSSTLMVTSTQNLKIAHYIKCGEKPVFSVQVVGALVGVATQILVKGRLFSDVHDICEPNQPNFLSCPNTSMLYTASMVWGLIGPARQFGRGSIYASLPYAAAIGAILPVLFWLWLKRHPTSWVRYVHIPVLLSGLMWIPSAGGINLSSWFLVGVIFQYWLRKTRFRWWAKFNYVLSAALDAGTIMGVLVGFLAFQLPKSGPVTLDWWGNTVWMKTADFTGTPIYNTDPVQGF